MCHVARRPVPVEGWQDDWDDLVNDPCFVSIQEWVFPESGVQVESDDCSRGEYTGEVVYSGCIEGTRSCRSSTA
jgi:hypothetical protein